MVDLGAINLRWIFDLTRADCGACLFLLVRMNGAPFVNATQWVGGKLVSFVSKLPVPACGGRAAVHEEIAARGEPTIRTHEPRAHMAFPC